MENKKAQQIFGMSFGVIFSILLIIVFIVVAFVVIKPFLETGKCAQVGIFKSDLQEEIDKAWTSDSSNFKFTGTLPSQIEYVCFANWSKPVNGFNDIVAEFKNYEVYDANLFLYPIKKACDMEHIKINHLDINKITLTNNPYCIINNKKIGIQISKGYGDALVSLS